mmetsp:Transcript_7752/g.17715  ORF Transcript_7752/g.17715 Transcript_7752/m.17715 type:complete len:105 (-) Transcript_7752:58-372(-)
MSLPGGRGLQQKIVLLLVFVGYALCFQGEYSPSSMPMKAGVNIPLRPGLSDNSFETHLGHHATPCANCGNDFHSTRACPDIVLFPVVLKTTVSLLFHLLSPFHS